jgi:dCMP deaminase
MQIARDVASRATCDRKHVGCVLVSTQRSIISTGYNGSIPGTPHCDDVGHMLVFDPTTNRQSCVRTTHAEVNAICQAAAEGRAVRSATAYVTASPCWPCFKALATAGIRRIVFGEMYKDERIWEFAKTANIELIDMSPPKPTSLACGCHCKGGCGDPYAACMHPCAEHTPL